MRAYSISGKVSIWIRNVRRRLHRHPFKAYTKTVLIRSFMDKTHLICAGYLERGGGRRVEKEEKQRENPYRWFGRKRKRYDSEK